MEFSRVFINSIYVITGIYILYVLFFKKNLNKEEYERLYRDIVNSDKYKAKGQFDKRD